MKRSLTYIVANYVASNINVGAAVLKLQKKMGKKSNLCILFHFEMLRLWDFL